MVEHGARIRFVSWVAAATTLSLFTAYNFPALLSESLDDAFGSIFPAVPFAALLTVLFLLRWDDLRDILAEDVPLSAEAKVRLLGALTLAGLLALREPAGQSLVLSGVAIVLTFYSSSLVLIPQAKRFILPYGLIYSAGVAAPAAIQWAFGEPLASLSAYLSAQFVSLTGVPVVWQGTEFALVSKTGETVAATVTPGCSSVISVTTFLGLLALMHFDTRKEIKSTLMLAVAGTAVLTLLNSARIAILIWVGYSSGVEAFWGIHNWVGYALFLGFYMAALVVYSNMGGRVPNGRKSTKFGGNTPI
ncbi:MAG: exosortase/archaeosortase family protein [Thaumarchaeota archaeon]|nr:exosortase/archaeosortase family protein [Nitrososphaerota archaeon]